MTQCWQRAISILANPKSNKYIILYIFSLGIFINACKNADSDLGLNLRSDKGELYSAETDTFTVIAYTVPEDSIQTDSLSTNILGAINDQAFGKSSAGIATEATLTQAGINFGINPKVDSVVLYIRWDKAYSYGKVGAQQPITIYSINEKIEDAKKYFSNYQPALGGAIANFNGVFNTTDSISLKIGKNIVKKGPGLLIKMEKNFGELFANADPTVFSTVSAFKDFFKGMVIKADDNTLGINQGAILGADFFSGNSQFIIYYNDSLNQSFVFNNNCENYNLYKTTAGNPDLLNQLANPSKHYNQTYVQTMGSCKTKIEIPHLFNLLNNLQNEKIIINEAALVFTPLNGSVSTQYPLPNRLYLFQPDEITGMNAPIIDFVDFIHPTLGPYSLFGGTYNTLSGDYTIRFTRHLQNMLDQKDQNLNRGFFVTIPSDKPITPSRLVINTTRNQSYKALKLRISYSKIKI